MTEVMSMQKVKVKDQGWGEYTKPEYEYFT